MNEIDSVFVGKMVKIHENSQKNDVFWKHEKISVIKKVFEKSLKSHMKRNIHSEPSDLIDDIDEIRSISFSFIILMVFYIERIWCHQKHYLLLIQVQSLYNIGISFNS